MTTRAINFAGGGSGGHIYPGLAIAQRVRAIDSTVSLRFICSDRAIDARILRDAREEFLPIPARPLSLRPAGAARLILGWGGCVRACRRALREAKAIGPTRMVTLGGFVAPPAVQAARAERVPVTLINLAAVPGKANRVLARRAQERFTAAGPARAGWTSVRPIVRAEAVAPAPARQCRERLGLRPDLPTLFVTGASQGARSINLAMVALLDRSPALLRGWQVLHQTGSDDNARYEDVYRAAQVPARVVGLLSEMGLAWGAADVAISRCGAGSVAEVWANATPTLFLPNPHPRDNHQRLNAEPRVMAGGVEVVIDTDDGERNAAALRPSLERLLRDDALRDRRRAALRALGPADGASVVAASLLSCRAGGGGDAPPGIPE